MSVTADVIAMAMGMAKPAAGSAQEQQWLMWISDAERIIRRRAVRLGVDYTTLDPDDLDYVIREAVVDHIRHPDDSTQVSVSIDDGSVSKSYRSGTGRVRILDEWWDILGLSGSGGAGAFSVDTAPCGWVHLPWCSLMFGATYCSCGVDIATYPIYEGAWP